MKNKLFSEQIGKAKQDMKTRYLAGESIPSIARTYQVSERDVYYHIAPLTSEDKALHAKNSDLRRVSIKNKRKEEASHGKEEQPSTTSTEQTTDSSLSDFVGE